jgi:hypothetical protein
MLTCVVGLLLFPISSNVLPNLLLESFSLPESGGLIVIGSLLISGAIFLRFRRSAGRKRAR